MPGVVSTGGSNSRSSAHRGATSRNLPVPPGPGSTWSPGTSLHKEISLTSSRPSTWPCARASAARPMRP